MDVLIEKCKLKIAIIDDGINMEFLYRLMKKKICITCLQIHESTCGAQYIAPLQAINHGTVCALILLETLEIEGVLEDVELISISVLDEARQHNLQKLSKAIQWGIENQMDLISLSVGSKEFSSAGKIIEVIKKTEGKKTIIVAAGANDGSITYPACLM